LEYACFMHSLEILSQIICYINGRSLFPVKINDTDEPVTVIYFVVSMVQLLTTTSVNTKSPSAFYDPGVIVTEVFKKLCNLSGTCQTCIYNDAVTNTLLSPVSHYLDGTEGANGPIGDWNLLQIADILSMIASTASGRHHLLYGQGNEKFTRSKSSPAHILAEFCRKGLANKLACSEPPSKAVIGNFVYVLRQLYSTSEGLLVLNGYDLNTKIATAWREAVRESDGAATPTPSIEGADSSLTRESQYM
jgi:hypothetical protein